MEILGETLPKIAFEKAGILKKGVTCISAQQKSSAKKVLIEEANKKASPIYFINTDNSLEYLVNLSGKSQIDNASLAVKTLEHLDNFKIPKSSIVKGLQTVQWFGRNQIIQKNPLIIFDVAHNIESMRSFLIYYKSLNIIEDSVLIIALQARKQIHKLSSIFKSIFKQIICTEAPSRDPMPANVLVKHFANGKNIKIIH